MLELTDEDWHKGLNVYLMNVIRPTRLVAPLMQAQLAGSIINISTFAAFEPDPVFPTLGVFRAGLAAFTKLFADKYAPDNVRMNVSGAWRACLFQFDKDLAAHGKSSLTRLFGWPWAMASRVAVR